MNSFHCYESGAIKNFQKCEQAPPTHLLRVSALTKRLNMTQSRIVPLLGLLLQIFSCLCEIQKTLKVEKLPFPTGSEYVAKVCLDVGDQKEATTCFKFRIFAYNEGYGTPFRINRQCPEGESCVDNFSWMAMIGWKTGMEDDGKQAFQVR